VGFEARVAAFPVISSNSNARFVVPEDSRAQFLAPTPQAGFK
jgi:hypothetical protein